MRFNYYSAIKAVDCGERLPRKVKKALIGTKISKSKLKRLLDTVVVQMQADTMYESPIITPYTFCPHCGCTEYYGSGNKTSYPEHWEYFFCLRCKEVVGYIDNSAFIHALECKDDNYNPVF